MVGMGIAASDAQAGGTLVVNSDGSKSWMGKLDKSFSVGDHMACDVVGIAGTRNMVCYITTATASASCTTTDTELIETLDAIIGFSHWVRFNTVAPDIGTCSMVTTSTSSFF
jgi:hypothetical protein